MCDFCKNIGTEEKAILTHELDVGDGNSCEYGVYVYRQNGKVYLSLCDALKEIKELKEKTQK